MSSSNPFDWSSTGGATFDKDIWNRASQGTLPDLGFNKDSGSGGGWDFGNWAQKNPKTAGFLKGFMGSYLNKDGTKKTDDEKAQKGTAFGIGATANKLAEGLTESRDPFFMHYQPPVLIQPGRKGALRVALETGIGAAKGFMEGGFPGAGGGALSTLSQNLDQF